MINREIKAVFIDWNGTLSTSKFFGHLETEKPDLYNQIQNILFGGELGQLINPWMVGEYNSEDIVTKLSQQLGLPYEELMHHFIFSCENMIISEEVLDLIDQTREEGIKVVIATDNMDSLDRWTSEALRLNEHFDWILNSYYLKSRKGQFDEEGKSLFFDDFLAENNLMPENTILIDDSEDKGGNLSRYGIEYRKVEFDNGLKAELQKILKAISPKS